MTLKSEMERIIEEDLLREQERARFGIGQPDMVNSPPHYRQGGIECIDAIKSAVVGAPPVEAVFVANILKYVWRYRTKNGMADLHKARWYLNALIEEVESRVNVQAG